MLNVDSSAPSFAGSDWDNNNLNGSLPQPDSVPMTRLQIFMAREVGGWPLYTIILALGQVRKKVSNMYAIC